MYRSFVQSYSYRVRSLTSDVEIQPVNSNQPNAIIKTSAVWDTGATQTFISRRLGEKLGIEPVDYVPVIGLNGRQKSGLAYISIKLPNDLTIPDKRTLIGDLPESIDILIGMDIIQLGDLHIANTGGQTLFSFVIPSLPHPINLAHEADRLNGEGD
jgi:hypothetical protein